LTAWRTASYGKGSISFGLATIPIGLFGARGAGGLGVKLLHARDGSRIVQKRFCKAEDVEVPGMRW
jgi:non-homologous end joining protein Ku